MLQKSSFYQFVTCDKKVVEVENTHIGQHRQMVHRLLLKVERPEQEDRTLGHLR